jgi:fructose-specific phosphotransferase system IIC component
MAQGSGFSTVAGNVGSGIGNFIGGLTSPLIGGTQTTTTTTSSKPQEEKNYTPIIIASVVGVIIIGVAIYFVIKNR